MWRSLRIGGRKEETNWWCREDEKVKVESESVSSFLPLCGFGSSPAPLATWVFKWGKSSSGLRSPLLPLSLCLIGFFYLRTEERSQRYIICKLHCSILLVNPTHRSPIINFLTFTILLSGVLQVLIKDSNSFKPSRIIPWLKSHWT